jgi:hypothetical protein
MNETFYFSQRFTFRVNTKEKRKKNPAVPVNLLHVFHKVSQMKGQWNNFEHVFISEWCIHKSNNKIMLWFFGVKNYRACSFWWGWEFSHHFFEAWKFLISILVMWRMWRMSSYVMTLSRYIPQSKIHLTSSRTAHESLLQFLNSQYFRAARRSQ